MNIVIASDSYKGSLDTFSVAKYIEIGIRRIYEDANITCFPVADGGEETVNAMVYGLGGTLVEKEVLGPMGAPCQAMYGLLPNNEAVIEMAAASGLTLLPAAQRDVRKTTTYGTGQLLLDALERGCRRVYLGVGGSATNDGGAGLAQALGAELLDAEGRDIGFGGGALKDLAQIDISKLDARLKETEVIVMSDVENPLCGKDGATAVYGRQKGVTPDMMQELDQNLYHYADLVRRQLGKDVLNQPGAGAGGGLGAGLLVFTQAVLRPGIDTVLDAVGFDNTVQSADLVITGEGSIDYQSAFGKVPVGIARRAAPYGVPVIAIVGSIQEGANIVYEHGIQSIFSTVCRPMGLQEAMEQTKELLADASERVMRCVRAGALMGQKQNEFAG